MSPARDTIFALSSGRPPAAIAVIRISGPRAGAALEALSGGIPAARQARLARLRDPDSGEIIDEALALWFPGPNSETGEDVAELQVHGGRAVIAGVLGALERIDGLRPAEAGEFTRRAFENGKLDLTAVEGLADLIGAETEAQRRQAFRQMKGLLGDRAEDWRRRLIQALALVEAGIDFSDEGDVPEDLLAPALDIVRGLRDEIAAVLADAGRGERLRDGLVVAIAGPPNAGKSTLLNRLARREVAIVSPIAGTTRDVIEVHLDLDGYPVTLLDTAGIRNSTDPVEQEGVRRARERAAAADLVLWVMDATALAAGGGAEADLRAGGLLGRAARLVAIGVDEDVEDGPTVDSRNRGDPPIWTVASKVDLLEQTNEPKIEGIKFWISSLDVTSLDGLMASLTGYSKAYFAEDCGIVTRQRHRAVLRETLTALARGLSAHASELVAEDLRRASTQLGRLTGRVDVEDVLGAIFADFCIGK